MSRMRVANVVAIRTGGDASRPPGADGRFVLAPPFRRRSACCGPERTGVTMEPITDERQMSEVAVQVLIVDDQAPFRAAERAVLSRLPGFALAAEAASGEEAIEVAARLVPDLVLMDINMGEVDGIEATRRITARLPDTKVILVSTYGIEDLPAGARTSGAIGYVNKDELSPRAIRRIWETGGDPAWTARVPE